MSNKKTKWTEENEVYLLKLISDNVNLEKISKKIKKSEKEIIHKLKKISVKMLNDKKTKDEISTTLKFLTDEQINKITEYNKKKISLKVFEDEGAADELSELGLHKTITKSTKKQVMSSENTEFQKIYTILEEINQKLNQLIKTNNNCVTNIKNEIKNDNSTDNDSDNNTDNNTDDKPMLIHKKDINDNSSSFISSGNDTDDVMNLIQNRTNEVNTMKTKYLNSLKKQ